MTRLRVINGRDLPARPPAEVLDALDSTARVHEELRASGLNVSFDVDENGSVRISVLDETGAVVHSFPAAAGLDALSGGQPGDLLAR